MLKQFLGKNDKEAKALGYDQAIKAAADKVIEILKQDQQSVAENYHSDLMKQTYAKFFKPAPPKTVLAVKKFLSDVIISLGTAQDNDYNDNDEEISWGQDLSDVREAYGKLRSNTSPNWFDIADAVLSYDTEFRESMLEWAEEELGSKLVDFLWDEVWEAKHKISKSDGSYNIDVDSGQEVTPHKSYDPEKDPPKTPRNIEWKVMINGEQKIKFGGVSNNQEAAMKVATNWARNHGYEREVQAGKIKVVQVQQGVAEAGSPAQQAAIAIAMKKAGKKPKSEAMLPKSAFAGSDKNKLGSAGQLKGSMKRPARAGDLVGEDRCVPISENVENIMDALINKIITNEAIQNKHR